VIDPWTGESFGFVHMSVASVDVGLAGETKRMLLESNTVGDWIGERGSVDWGMIEGRV
jgi:hypothetical protein